MNIPFALLPDTHSIINIKGLFAGELPTLVFDATGNQESMVNAFQYVAHGGSLVYVGLFQGDVTFNDPEFHKRELTLLASRNATGNAFTKIIKLMESEKIDAAPWITHRARLQEVPTTFSQWLDPQNKVIKGTSLSSIIHPSSLQKP
jgi:threonine dehydrogenase-like Zn-dependent dehydrogenase